MNSLPGLMQADVLRIENTTRTSNLPTETTVFTVLHILKLLFFSFEKCFSWAPYTSA